MRFKRESRGSREGESLSPNPSTACRTKSSVSELMGRVWHKLGIRLPPNVKFRHSNASIFGNKRAEEKNSLISGSSLSVTFSLSNEANTNLIAHNNDRLPLRTSSLSEETKTNLIAHNNSGLIFSFSCCLKG